MLNKEAFPDVQNITEEILDGIDVKMVVRSLNTTQNLAIEEAAYAKKAENGEKTKDSKKIKYAEKEIVFNTLPNEPGEDSNEKALPVAKIIMADFENLIRNISIGSESPWVAAALFAAFRKMGTDLKLVKPSGEYFKKHESGKIIIPSMFYYVGEYESHAHNPSLVVAIDIPNRVDLISAKEFSGINWIPQSKVIGATPSSGVKFLGNDAIMALMAIGELDRL